MREGSAAKRRRANNLRIDIGVHTPAEETARQAQPLEDWNIAGDESDGRCSTCAPFSFFTHSLQTLESLPVSSEPQSWSDTASPTSYTAVTRLLLAEATTRSSSRAAFTHEEDPARTAHHSCQSQLTRRGHKHLLRIARALTSSRRRPFTHTPQDFTGQRRGLLFNPTAPSHSSS